MSTSAFAAAQEPAFDWTMPARLGAHRDGAGLMEYASSADAVETAPFAVHLRVGRWLCDRTSKYSWSVDGHALEQGKGDCSLPLLFSAEGTYEVKLGVEDGTGQRTSYRREVVVKDWLVVSLGDSVASGEGNPDVPRAFKHAVWQNPRCHGSTHAAPVQAALALERADARTSTTFVNLACSGASVQSGLLGGYKGIDAPKGIEPALLPSQVEELRSIADRGEVDAVLLSVGANDVYFGRIVEFCLRFRDCLKRRFDPRPRADRLGPSEAGNLTEVVKRALGRLKGSYALLAHRLQGLVEPDRVIVSTYFDPTRGSDGRTCRKIGFPHVPGIGISRRQAEWAYDDLLAPLNREITAAAAQAGWTPVSGVAEAFRRHGYCAGKQSWIRTLSRSVRSQAGETLTSRVAGMLHPNEAGHQAIAVLLTRALKRQLYGAGGARAPHRPPSGETATVTVEDSGKVVTLAAPASAPDGNVEQTAGRIGLGVAGLTAAALAALWWRRRRRPELPPPVGETAAITAALSPASPRVAKRFGRLLLTSADWVHRRVESVEFVDDATARRRISVDFTLPSGDRTNKPTQVPLMLLHKRSLTSFDVRDEADASLPLLTATQAAELVAGYLIVVAEKAIGAKAPPQLRNLCGEIASAPPLAAHAALRTITMSLPGDLVERLRGSEAFRAATTTFADSFPVIVELKRADRRRVVKIAYDQPVGGQPKLAARLGIVPLTLDFPLPELGDAGSRHVEFRRAPGLETVEVRLLALTPAGEPLFTGGAGLAQERHLYVPEAPRGTHGIARVGLRARRQGILIGGPLFAAVTAVLLTGAWFALPGIASRDAVGPLLLAVPAVLGVYLGTSAPHPLASTMLLGPRGLVFLSGLLSFVSAAMLALDPSVLALRWALGVTAGLSWSTFLGLLATYLLPQAIRAGSQPPTS